MLFEAMDAFIRWDQRSEHETVFRKGLQSRVSSPPDDVAQLCGGAGDTATLLIRRGYQGGPNFDIFVGFGLLNAEVQDHFLKYLKYRKPKILLISTPALA